MKKALTLFAACLFVLGARAQGDLMTINSDAQSLGMGGITMTNISGGHAIYTNPAASIFSRNKMQLSGSYLPLGENYYTSVSGFYNFDNRNLMQVGWRRYNMSWDANEMSFDLGYSRRLGEKWSVGIVGRYFRTHPYNFFKTRQPANALTVDLSAMYVLPLKWKHYSMLRIGLKLGNMGDYLDQSRDSGPSMTFDAGIALDTFISDAHELTFGFDLGCLIAGPDVGNFWMSPGIEYNLMQLIQLRAGYHFVTHSNYYPGFGSIGAGVRFLHARVDFAYLFLRRDVSKMKDTWCISLGFDF